MVNYSGLWRLTQSGDLDDPVSWVNVQVSSIRVSVRVSQVTTEASYTSQDFSPSLPAL